MASRIPRSFTTEELDDIMVRLKRSESRESVGQVYGCHFKTIEKCMNDSPLSALYRDVMDWRQANGRRAGGYRRRRKPKTHRMPPLPKGSGFVLMLPGTVSETARNHTSTRSRWPVRTRSEFSGAEIAAMETRLLRRVLRHDEGGHR